VTEGQFLRHTSLMRTSLSFYYRHRFPTEIRGISQNQGTAPLPGSETLINEMQPIDSLVIGAQAQTRFSLLLIGVFSTILSG